MNVYELAKRIAESIFILTKSLFLCVSFYFLFDIVLSLSFISEKICSFASVQLIVISFHADA